MAFMSRQPLMLWKINKLYFIGKTLFSIKPTMVFNVYFIFPLDRLLAYKTAVDGLRRACMMYAETYRFNEKQFFHLILGRHFCNS